MEKIQLKKGTRIKFRNVYESRYKWGYLHGVCHDTCKFFFMADYGSNNIESADLCRFNSKGWYRSDQIEIVDNENFDTQLLAAKKSIVRLGEILNEVVDTLAKFLNGHPELFADDVVKQYPQYLDLIEVKDAGEADEIRSAGYFMCTTEIDGLEKMLVAESPSDEEAIGLYEWWRYPGEKEWNK